MIGYETARGELVASRLTEATPSAEAVRFVASGSEAVADVDAALRVPTPAATSSSKIDGHFNGGSDYAMYNSLVAYTDASNAGGRPVASDPLLRGHPPRGGRHHRAGALE